MITQENLDQHDDRNLTKAIIRMNELGYAVFDGNKEMDKPYVTAIRPGEPSYRIDIATGDNCLSQAINWHCDRFESEALASTK